MEAAVSGQNRCFWLSLTSFLIDLCLNSTLFPLYTIIMLSCSDWMCRERRWPPHPIPSHLSPLCLLWEESFLLPPSIHPTAHGVSLGEKVESHEKCPAARYMKVWNCRLLFALGPVPQKVFLLLLTERLNLRLMAAAAAAPRPPPALIAFVSRSPPIYCCNFSNFSGLVVWRQKAAALWEMYIKLRTKETRGELLSVTLTDPDATSSNE